MPRVSTIIPCYNGRRYIGEALASVLGQSYADLEVLVVDDGSTDASAEVVERYQSDRRVRLIRHGENRGIPAARNSGIKAARGEYVAFLDQDDLWLPHKLSRQVEAFENVAPADLGLVFSDVEVMDECRGRRYRHGSVPAGINRAGREEVARALYLRNFIPLVSVLVKRECFEKLGLLDQTLTGGSDDYEFCLRVAVNYRLLYLPGALAKRRIHGANYSDMERIFPDAVRVIEGFAARIPYLSDLKARRLSDLWHMLAMTRWRKGDRAGSKEALQEALRLRSTNWKAAAALALCRLGGLGAGVLSAWYRWR